MRGHYTAVHSFTSVKVVFQEFSMHLLCQVKFSFISWYYTLRHCCFHLAPKATDLDWLLGVGKVTSAFATSKIQVAATLSGNSEQLAMVASSTAHSLIRGSSETKNVGCSSTSSSNYASSSFIASSFISTEAESTVSTSQIELQPGTFNLAIIGSVDWAGSSADDLLAWSAILSLPSARYYLFDCTTSTKLRCRFNFLS